MNPSNKALVSGIYTIERYFQCVEKNVYIHEFDVVNTIGDDTGLIEKQNRLQDILAKRAEDDESQIPDIIALYEKYLGGRWLWDEKWKEFYKEQNQHARKVNTMGKPTKKAKAMREGQKKLIRKISLALANIPTSIQA
jgi:hypothetical protein